VSRADSAGLALLVEWQRLARRAGRELRFTDIPEQVQSLIHVSGLSQAFGLNDH
jgi:phospholipid transport system transporter-binding protein